MPEIFSSVVANLANDLKLWFPPDFDYYTMLNKVAQDAGVCIQFDDSACVTGGSQSSCKLQGLWYSMEQAYSLLATALAIHGIRTTVKEKDPASFLSSKTASQQCTAPPTKRKSTNMKHRKKSVANSENSDTQDCDDEMIYLTEERSGHVSGTDKQVTQDCSALVVSVTLGEHQEQKIAQLGPKPTLCNNEPEVNSSKNNRKTSEGSPFQCIGKQHKSRRLSKTKSAPKHMSHVNHKYSFLSKYGDHSYPSLGRTVRKRRAVFPLEIGNAEPAAKRKRGRPKKNNEQGQTEFACSECKFVASSRSKLTDHIHRKHKGNPVSCDLCGKIFHNQMYMLRHRSSHTGPQHCCDVCGKMFKIQKAMVNHRKTHEDGYKRPVFPCKLCSKTFCSQYIVDCHVKSAHLGQRKSYLCSFCGKKFTTKHSLQEHVNAHSGVKPHVCEICGKGFSYDSALRDHRFTHDALKQFKCSLCNKSFCQRSGLKMHMRIHKDSKQFQCQECGREFTQKQALQRHERVHKGVKPFTCRMCARSFTDASIIRRHLTLVHKIHKDAKTWREDIICTIQPDLDYHVSFVGAREEGPESKRSQTERNRNQARIVFQSRSLSGRSRQRSHAQHSENPTTNARISEVHLPICLQTVTTVSDSICIASEGQECLPQRALQKDAETIDIGNSGSTHTPESHAHQQTALHNSDYPPHSVQLQVPPIVNQEPHPSADSADVRNVAAAETATRPGHLDHSSAPANTTDSASALHTTASTSYEYDTAVQYGYPQGVLLKNNMLDEQQQQHQKSPVISSQHLQQHNTSGSFSACISITTTAMTTTTTTTKTSPSTIAAPQPWPSFYYYSQLASQFGMNFSSDYSYPSTGAFPGVGLSPTSPSFVDHAAPVHPAPIHPRPQALHGGDLAQGLGGRDGMDLFGGSGSQNLRPLPSGGDLELPRSGLPLDGGSAMEVPSGAATLPSPLVHYKHGDDISRSDIL